MKVEGDFYTQTGLGNSWTQVWKRLKVSSESQLAKDLTGVWILAGIPGNFEENPQIKGNQIKFIVGGQWCLTQSDPNGSVIYHYGGTCTLNGDEYIEKIEYSNENSVYLINQTSKFKMKVEGDFYTQTGIGNNSKQVWKRLKVSSTSIKSEQTSPSSGDAAVPHSAQDGSADVSAQDQKLLNNLRDMQAAHNRHDLEAELSFYADDAQFEVVGRSIITGKTKLRSLFTQDAQRNSRLTLTDFKVQGDTVVCKGKEQNDHITEQGLDCIYFEECRFIFRDGLIQEVKTTLSH
ncbi:MAG: nuclear transport factor 2 family protein [Sedimentisphaerales bacterium]|nr:nuclear transport factor 2 family protein [Sedimentisphaerales bacterium]